MIIILVMYPTAIGARRGCEHKDCPNNLFQLFNYLLPFLISYTQLKILCKINRPVGLFCKGKFFPRIMKGEFVSANDI
ncbi:hypothetical protein DWZ06_01325 [Phocaeicola vulgatus]|nr:hypothetical protein DXD65_15440 [Bacteroides sp. 4_1_36]RGQ28300.1 hypothetical protein DWZ06_01325 [Phocaeicola vulgatus]RJV05566.1 hypothetical protein DWZ03_15885 [Bacteroides sp. AF29-11]